MSVLEFLLPRGLPRHLPRLGRFPRSRPDRHHCLRTCPKPNDGRRYRTTSASNKPAPVLDKSDAQQQHNPLGAYYQDLLDHPLPNHSLPPTTSPISPSSTATASATAATPTSSSTGQPLDPSQAERIAKARVVFGSRLAGPGQRQAQIDSASTLIAGILVPPRPEEPDNCCMSGCVNCVWDNYRDEIEEWAAKSKEARARIKAAEGSVDDDGGGSETNWDGLGVGVNGQEEDLFGGIPVGIREFMRVEKRLKAQHAREEASGSSASSG